MFPRIISRERTIAALERMGIFVTDNYVCDIETAFGTAYVWAVDDRGQTSFYIRDEVIRLMRQAKAARCQAA